MVLLLLFLCFPGVPAVLLNGNVTPYAGSLDELRRELMSVLAQQAARIDSLEKQLRVHQNGNISPNTCYYIKYIHRYRLFVYSSFILFCTFV